VIQERKLTRMQNKLTSQVQQESDDIGKCVTDRREWGVGVRICSEVE